MFSQPMDENSITKDKLTLKDDKNQTITITEEPKYEPENKTAKFVLASDLSPSTTYTATISLGITNEDGITMKEDKKWIFTTGTKSAGIRKF